MEARRVFVATFDGWYNDEHRGLYLHLVYDGTLVDSLRLMEDMMSTTVCEVWILSR